LRLDPATGKKLSEFQLPPVNGNQDPPRWGYLNVCEDYLIGGADPLYDPSLKLKAPVKAVNDDDAKKPGETGSSTLTQLKGFDNDNLSASRHLVVLDRHSGKVLWSAPARSGFRHNAICAGGGRLYAIDRLSGSEVNRLKRRGETPSVKSRLVVFDLRSGRELWSTEDNVFGTWLSYSVGRDILVESGRVARDTLFDEPKGMRAYRGLNGSMLWFQPTFVGPAMIHGDVVLKDRSACDLLTGLPRMRQDPITGLPVEWSWVRNYGCNTPAASEHLLTFRSGAAGYFDLCNDGGTGNLGGFRSSCTNNLIVAGGLLNVPDYTRTCTCSYQNQSSLALIHWPDAEMWTSFGPGELKGSVRRVGINFGAPGDRKAPDGTLWLEYPSVGGPSPVVPVTTNPAKPELFRRHASRISGDLNWVAASGARGLSEVVVRLSKDEEKERVYTVRLYFSEPDDVKPGQRLFNVALQGQEVLREFDIVHDVGRANRALVKEIRGVKVTRNLTLRFTPSTKATVKSPILCGLEVLAEGW
jgi:hypothetical protein